jgi:hypothetical protein
MTTDAHPGRFHASDKVVRVRTLLMAGGLVLLALLVFIGVNALFGDDDKAKNQITGTSKDSYTLSYPGSWRPLSGDQLRKQPGNPLAVVRRKDGKGFVVLRREGRAPKNFNAFSADLSRALDRRLPDFQKRSSKVIEIGAGKAFFLSYIRESKGTVHTVVVVPDGKRSYVLNTVSRGGAEDVARQVARIILSFKA